MMRWSQRQRAMLRAMGLPVWDAAPRPARVARSPTGQAAPAADTGPTPAASEAPAARAAPLARPLPQPDAPPVPAHEALDVAQLDWQALREAVASCRACTLCKSRTQTVFGGGHPRAQWMVVGEAPGAQEDAQGEPFVGKSGQLLDAMLHALGLTRDAAAPARQVFIANTLKCRPPENRNPLPEELARCEPFLLRQIELVAPRVILAMGRFAVQALLRSDQPIGRLRGRVHRYHDVPLVVTYHPAYLLRNPLDKARAWDDLRLALDVWRRSGGGG